MAHLFSAPPIDESLLWSQAMPHVEKMRGDIPSQHDLQLYVEKYGIDLATSIFYQSILASNIHGPVIKDLDGICSEGVTKASKRSVKILIIPALYHKEHPELGSDGKLIQEVATRFGIASSILPVLSLGSVQSNGAIISDAIRKENSESLIICTLSKGASDFRYAMEHLAPELSSKISAWINISGTVHGSSSVEKILSSFYKRLYFKAVSKVIRAEYGCIEEVRSAHHFWSNPWSLSKDILVLNVLPIPILPHVTKKISSHYMKLSSFGPNDGVALSYEGLYLPGYIYPIWGCDHFLRTPFMGSLLSRMFTYLLLRL